jgi:hypothetical protein
MSKTQLDVSNDVLQQFYSDNRNIPIKSMVICPMNDYGKQFNAYSIKVLNPSNIKAAIGIVKESFVQMELQYSGVAILSIEFEKSKS